MILSMSGGAGGAYLKAIKNIKSSAIIKEIITTDAIIEPMYLPGLTSLEWILLKDAPVLSILSIRERRS